MTNLISDLLDVSRVTTGLIELDRQPLDLKQIALESVEQVRPLIEARRHHFTLHACSDAAIVLGDRKRLVQVMTNLLQNAAKYTPEGGNIALSIATRADEVVISVQDDGLGMDAQLLPHVFELFSQAKRSSDRSQGGLGLGLALVKSLVALHGGRVIAASDGNGKGSIFALFFPQFSAPSAIEPDLAATTVRTAVFKPLRLLVVDDNADAANVLAMFLRAVGHQVLVEYEPEAALACAQREAPDVCLLDIGLPGMSGNELARRLRAMPQTARATLIAVTGYGQEYDKCTSIVAGFDHYFVKPVDTARLLERLAEIDPA